jgi:F0F1-type ATP synthase assembly protein I
VTPEPGRKGSSNIMQLADLGLRLALSVALATFAGLKLDQWFDTSPWLLILCSLLGVVAGMVSTIRGVGRWQSAADRDKHAEPGGPSKGSRDEPS